jgi:hypothetical protein
VKPATSKSATGVPGSYAPLSPQLWGPPAFPLEGFFSLNAQFRDLRFLPWKYQLLVRLSECFRRTSLKISELAYFADSLYVSSVKNNDQTTANTEPRISLEPPLSAIESNLPLPVTVPHDRAS